MDEAFQEGRMTGKKEEEIPRKRIRGVFSTESSQYLGFGDTKKKVSQQVFVYAEEQTDGAVVIQRLNRSFMPGGPKKKLSKDALLKDYMPEPAMYQNKVVPIMRRVEEAVERGDAHRERQELFSAEFEYKNALRVDEEHIRATFGLGLTYIDRNEKQSAEMVFRKLVAMDAAFEPEHKHIFNEFGIRMRKLKMFKQAMKYYSRAYQLSKDDEHLIYNMARTLFEKGRPATARRFLHKALSMNPGFEECKKFLEFMENELASRNGQS